jgi:plastocyanin
MNRRTFLATGVGLTTTALAGCGAQGSAQPADDFDVGMSTDAFRPATLTVESGETVVWQNTSKQGHTVTAYEDEIPAGAEYFATGGFDSQSAAEAAWIDGTGGRLAQGDTYQHTFEVPGEYNYFCIPHETVGMAGVVTVVDSTPTE